MCLKAKVYLLNIMYPQRHLMFTVVMPRFKWTYFDAYGRQLLKRKPILVFTSRLGGTEQVLK